MQHYDRTTITEEPTPRCRDCRLKPCEICAHPIIDADQDQRSDYELAKSPAPDALMEFPGLEDSAKKD